MYFRALAAFVVGTLVVGSNAAADDPVEARLEAAKAEYEGAIATARQGLLDDLKRREAAVQKTGNLDGLLLARAETKAFEENGTLPRSAPISGYEGKLRTARARLRDAYATAIKQYTQEGRIELAQTVQKELDEFIKDNEIVYQVRFDDKVVISAKNEHGYVVGAVAKGEKVSLQYVSGRWKAWGKNATESPDERIQEDKDHCRVAVCAVGDKGRTRVLAVVPHSTSATPFVWAADKPIDKVVLRINDADGDFTSNPDGRVTYRLRVYEPTKTPKPFPPAPVPPAVKKGVPLFDGKTLDGWLQGKFTSWKVVDGQMVGTGNGVVGFLLRDGTKCSDFTLRCRMIPPEDKGSYLGFWIDKSGSNGYLPGYRLVVGRHAFGELKRAVGQGDDRVEVTPKELTLQPGEAVELDIQVVDRKLTVSANGQIILDHHKLIGPESEGYLGLRPSKGSTLVVREITLLKHDRPR